MKHTRLAATILMVLTFLLCAIPAAALAATSTTTASPAAASVSATANAPLAVGPVDSQFWPQGDTANPNRLAIITDIQLAPSVKLPAKVRIPISPGATVEWAGEILGGDSNRDPSRTFKVVDGKGGKYAEFTLEQSRRGQIDCAGGPLTFSGDQVSFSTAWVQSVETTSVLLTVRFPAGASRIVIDPKPQVAPQTNMQGESLYIVPLSTLGLGDKQDVKVSYSTNPSGAAPSSPLGIRVLLIVVGVALVAALGVLAFAITRQRQDSQGDDDDYDDDGDFADEEDSAPEEPVSHEADDAAEDDLDLFAD